MTTALHDRKLKRRFELMDANHDGVLERGDYEALAQHLIQGLGTPPDTPKARAVVETYTRFWDNYISRMDADGDGKVTKQEYIEAIDRQTLDPDAFDRAFQPHFQAVARLCDTDDDGNVDRDEFTRMMRVHGVSDQDASVSFDQIDQDHDGKLSVDELVNAARNYYISDEPNVPGSSFFGRL
ncbi:MAG: EF-hand domain-containing protein [Micromonosporaceae bacterium]